MDKSNINQSNAMAEMHMKQAFYAQSQNRAVQDAIALPLMVQEQDRVYSAIADLEKQLDWLIDKIQPICQPAPAVPSGEGSAGQQIEATPSVTRQALIEFRKRIDEMSRRISEVKYTIEV
jgi:hypothetical protein